MTVEAAFRSQLALQDQRILYDYWRSKAGRRIAPSRAEIDPVALPGLLPGLSVMRVGAQMEDLLCRLAGTRLRDIFGVEITGKRFFSLDLGDKRDYWKCAYHHVIHDKRPMHGVLKSPFASRDHQTLFWLRLPLSEEGREIDHVLGYDMALAAAVAEIEAPHVIARGLMAS